MLRLLLPALLFVVSGFTGLAHAGDTALTTLRQQQANVYGLVRSFHMQTLLSGDPGRTAQLKAAVEASRKAIESLPQNTGNAALDSAIKEIRAAWPPFQKLALANNIAEDGYTDDNLIGGLYDQADILLKAFDNAIKAVPAGKQRAQADRVHATSLLIQRTVASYLKRGAQMSPDVGSEDPFDVGEATKNLDKQMQALLRELKNDPAMANVNSKWNFIRKSLANYNEKTVPFITDRYTSQINEGLQQIAASLDKK